MYSHLTSARALFQIKRRRPSLHAHFILGERHKPISYTSLYTDTETQQYAKQIDALYDRAESKLTRPLTRDETNFVEGERLITKYDFRHFYRNYCTIINNDGQLIHPQPTLAQRITLDVWGEMEEARMAVMILQLKARQLGVTTLVGQAILHRTLFYDRSFNYIASSDEDNTRDKVGGKITLSLYNLPYYLLPSRINGPFDSGETLFECPRSGSFIAVQHGRQKKGIGRGDTTTCVHLTELSEFQNPESIVEAGLLKTFHPTPRHFLVFEYTAEGTGNWSHQLWEDSKENWPKRRSNFNPVFLPYFIDELFYPTESWLRSHHPEALPEVPAEWQPSLKTIAHSERARDYVLSKDYIVKHLGRDWTLPREKQFYWEVEREEHERKNIINVFYGELASNDIEAFQTKRHGIFQADLLEDIKTGIKSDISLYALRGDKVSPELTPHSSEFDPDRGGYKITANWDQERVYNFTLTPIKFNNYPHIIWDNRFIIWEEPQPGYQYALGIDTGGGIGRDRSVIEVIRYRPGEPDLQVAEYASAYASALDIWPHAYALATYYSAPANKQCRVAVECAFSGDALQKDLRLAGWSNFHIWIRWDNRIMNKVRSKKIGWFTSGWSRKALVEHTVKAIKSKWIILSSPWLIDELGTMETDDLLWNARADGDNVHDDRFMALGIAFMSLHELDKQKGEWTPPVFESPPVAPESSGPMINLYADTMEDDSTDDDLLRAAGW